MFEGKGSNCLGIVWTDTSPSDETPSLDAPKPPPNQALAHRADRHLVFLSSSVQLGLLGDSLIDSTVTRVAASAAIWSTAVRYR